MLMEYSKLKETELFSFFHFTETGRRPHPSGMIEILLKPGGFQEFIDVAMKVDRFMGVHEGALLLDREWIGGPMTINPFGKDLAKSFVEAMTPADDKAKATAVVSTIWGVSGLGDQTLHLSDKQEDEQQHIEKLANVYFGTEKCFSLELTESKMLIENVEDVGRSRLRIVISSLDSR
jgi:hypothetical protein